MYAVIKTGGQQYKVAVGDFIRIEKLEHEIGQSLHFDEVLMVANAGSIQVGSPNLANVKVLAEVMQQGRHRKIEILKFRRRKHHMKRQGHRQYYTAVKITGIEGIE